ncbi:MAG: LLM class F420-dependent oxidoreductase, partial [Candidatus Lambdaproteobacteria bacterium]|nr:LLM class F420-dependent oxidoreductase [Candidatus Lambdaproteobacteria bacterium]
MTRSTRLALTLPEPGDVQASLARAEWAEREGFDDVWFADTGGVDALTAAAAVAMRTSRVRIGIAVVPVFTRTPAVIASTAMTISQLAPERFVLGLGASSHAMIEGWHGLPFDKPLTRVRETARLVRAMLDGEKTAFQGELLRSHGYRVNPPVRGHVPLYVGALRGRMLENAAELGEGVVINLYPRSHLPQIMARIAAGAQRAGKSAEALDVVSRIQVCVTDDVPGALATARARFAPYFATPVYNKFLAWCGYPEVAATIAEGWARKDREKTMSALSDELIHQIVVIGDEETCRAEVRDHVVRGVTTPIIASLLHEPEA